MSTAQSWPQRMNATDALFWTMDRIPEMRSTIGVLVTLERSPPRERMRAEFERLACNLPRMRQWVADVPLGLAPPEWIEDEQFDLDYHLRYVAVPPPGDIEALLQELSPLYATTLDRDRPLWEAYVAEGLLDGRGAVFIKMHHCLTDGVGGSRLFAELMGARMAAVSATRFVSIRQSDIASLLWRAAGYNVGETLRGMLELIRLLGTAALSPAETARSLARGISTLAGFGRELVMPRADSPLDHHRSLSRQLSTFEMSLPEIDSIRRPLQATNNDVVLTIVSGAMHRWHSSHGADVHELRALVPVNLRNEADPHAGNRLALLAVSLPIGEPSPLRRLRVIQERMGQIKTDRRATMYPFLARFMTALPLPVAKQLGRQQTMRTNFVCTNVPGPGRLCYLAGELIERVYPYAPLVGDHPVAIALYTYRDRVLVGLDVDPLAMDDLPLFRDALQEAYEEVLNVGRRAEGGRRGARRTPRRQTKAAS